MRKFLAAAVFVLALPAAGTAAPICVAGTLQSYIALGAGGCEVGGALFSHFSSAASTAGGTEIDSDDVVVSPFSLGLEFTLTAAAEAGELAGILIGYGLSGPSLASLGLSMTGSSASFDGVVTAVEEVCAGAAFSPFPICGGGAATLIVYDIGVDSDTDESGSVPLAPFLDIFVDIAVDGGLLGEAALDGKVRTSFARGAAVPEPATMLLVSAGVIAALARRRRPAR
jgi:hypothetical protein